MLLKNNKVRLLVALFVVVLLSLIFAENTGDGGNRIIRSDTDKQTNLSRNHLLPNPTPSTVGRRRLDDDETFSPSQSSSPTMSETRDRSDVMQYCCNRKYLIPSAVVTLMVGVSVVSIPL